LLSDPCDDIVCVNGSCNEGICECAEGWKGASCNEVDFNFVGEYRSTQFGLAECPNPNDEFTLETNNDNQVCNTANNVTSCLEVLLRFNDDGTYFLNVIEVTISGGITRGDPTVIRDTYTTNGNTATLLCDGNPCSSVSLDMTQQFATWDQRRSSSSQCAVRWELTRQ